MGVSKGRTMFPKMKQYGLDKLSDAEKAAIVDEMIECLDEPGKISPLTEAQFAELDRRLADYEANPDQKVYSWEEVKAFVRAK